MTRPLSTIACEITRDWKEVNFAAKPYLGAMLVMDGIDTITGPMTAARLSPISCRTRRRGAAKSLAGL